MNYNEFLTWFRETGYEWKGWPEWQEGMIIYTLDFDDSSQEWMTHEQGKTEFWGTDEGIRTDHEAACLVRDFLMFHKDMRGLWPVCPRDQENMNRILVLQVESQMEGEAGHE